MHKRPSYLFPILLVLYEIATYLSNDMYLPALPVMSKELGFSQDQAQLTFTVWFVGAASIQLVLGALSDRFGRRPILLGGCLLFLIATLISVFATGITAFLIARFIQGAVIGSIIVAGYASIHETYNQREAIKLLALMSSITVIAPAFGPLLGGIVLLVAGWRWIFGLLAIWLFLSTVSLYKWMPETNPPALRRPLQLRSIASDYLAILANGRFMSMMTIVCLQFLVFIAWLTTIPFLIIQQFHYSPVMFGLVQITVFGCYILVSRYVDHLIDYLGIPRMVCLGVLLILASGILAVILASLFPFFLGGLILTMVIFSGSTGLTFSPLNRLAVEASHQPMGARMAIGATLFNAFAAVGSILASYFYNGTLTSMSYILLGVGVLECVIFFVWVQREL